MKVFVANIIEEKCLSRLALECTHTLEKEKKSSNVFVVFQEERIDSNYLFNRTYFSTQNIINNYAHDIAREVDRHFIAAIDRMAIPNNLSYSMSSSNASSSTREEFRRYQQEVSRFFNPNPADRIAEYLRPTNIRAKLIPNSIRHFGRQTCKCGSSYKGWNFFKHRKCIQPQCVNYYKGFRSEDFNPDLAWFSWVSKRWEAINDPPSST